MIKSIERFVLVFLFGVNLVGLFISPVQAEVFDDMLKQKLRNECSQVRDFLLDKGLGQQELTYREQKNTELKYWTLNAGDVDIPVPDYNYEFKSARYYNDKLFITLRSEGLVAIRIAIGRNDFCDMSNYHELIKKGYCDIKLDGKVNDDNLHNSIDVDLMAFQYNISDLACESIEQDDDLLPWYMLKRKVAGESGKGNEWPNLWFYAERSARGYIYNQEIGDKNKIVAVLTSGEHKYVASYSYTAEAAEKMDNFAYLIESSVENGILIDAPEWVDTLIDSETITNLSIDLLEEAEGEY